MTLYRTAPQVPPVRRPLTYQELETVRAAIDSPATGALEMADRVIAAVFAALLGDLTPKPASELAAHRPWYAIPVNQWVAIATATTDRAATWGAAIETEIHLAHSLPHTYDDPDASTPRLEPADRPRITWAAITREAADTITACHRHIADLGLAYGTGSHHYLDAASSWITALTRIFGDSPRANVTVQPAGPLSLTVSCDTGPGLAVTFHGQPHHCTVDGCHAVRHVLDDGEPCWLPAIPGTPVLDHDHQPHYPLDGPQPGGWVLHS